MSKKSEWIIGIRDGIPHLTDRKELIRCKDCTHWDEATVKSKRTIAVTQRGDRKMDDLISRQAAIKAIEDLQDCYNGFSDSFDKACIIGVLEELPSAQPEIIKCKDCKFWHEDVANRINLISSIPRGGCKLVRGITSGEFFCALGERKEINSR